MADKLRVVDHYSGMGAFEEALINGLGLPPEQIKLLKTEYNAGKKALWEALHSDKGIGGKEGIIHIDDATSKDVAPENVEKLLGGKPDIFMSSPSCKGFSRLGKGEGLNQDESAFFIDSNRNRVFSEPKTWLHEITSGMKADDRKVLDVAHSLSKEDASDWDFDSPKDYLDLEKVDALWNKLKEEGRLRQAYTLQNGLFGPMNNTHDYRLNYELNPRFFHSKNPERKRGAPDELIDNYLVSRRDKIYDPDLLLNYNIGPDDDLYSIYSSDALYNKNYTGDRKRMSVKNLLGRVVASSNTSPTKIRSSFEKARGDMPLVVYKLSDAEMDKVLKGEVSPEELYYTYDPEGKWDKTLPTKSQQQLVQTMKGKYKLGDSINNKSSQIKPGEIYGIDTLSPREMAVAMGWKGKAGDIIEGIANKAGHKPYNLAAKLFGDAYPQQQMVYMLLHNPVLWEKFPDQMKLAARKFKSVAPSDIQVKRNLVPVGHLNVNRRF